MLLLAGGRFDCFRKTRFKHSLIDGVPCLNENDCNQVAWFTVLLYPVGAGELKGQSHEQ